ncbi:MAG: sensor histidine kinase [Rhodothermaceae bacterium]
MFNPYISNNKILSIYFAFWILLSTANSILLINVFDVEFSSVMIFILSFYLPYSFVGLSFWYPAQYMSFDKYSTFEIIWKHSIAAVVSSLLVVGLGYYVLLKMFIQSELEMELLSQHVLWIFVGGVLFYVMITMVNYLIIYYNNYQQKMIQEVKLKSDLKEAELKSLKYQINPHFIFNSLNSISSLTLFDGERAREMTIKLSDYMRGMLSKNEKQFNKLEDELKNIRLYLDIEKIRFEDKFEYVENIPTDILMSKVPNMLFQPLFENAIKHGVYESLEKVTITLSAKKLDEYIKYELSNNYDPEAVHRKGEGIGLKNIKDRLKLFYNQENLFITENRQNIFNAILYIPIIEEKDESK